MQVIDPAVGIAAADARFLFIRSCCQQQPACSSHQVTSFLVLSFFSCRRRVSFSFSFFSRRQLSTLVTGGLIAALNYVSQNRKFSGQGE